MQELSHILDNHILVVAIVACLLAQGAKLLVRGIQTHKLDFRAIVETGGMPSAHSALVTALATGVGRTIGWDSIEFAIASVFAVIVMYDAAGVRQAAGKQARLLNQIVDELFQEDGEFNEERLKELLGHTPFQVIVGAALGAISSYMIYPA